MALSAGDDSSTRFTLVLAIAFLLHVLALVLTPGPALKPWPEKTIQVQLTSPGAAQQAAPASEPTVAEPLLSDVEPIPVPTPSIAATSPAAPSPPVITVDAASPENTQPTLSDVEPVSVPTPGTATTSPTASSAPVPTVETTSPKYTQSAPAITASTPSSPEEIRQESTQIQPIMTPYEREVRLKIAWETRYDPLLNELQAPRRVTLELQLMRNGALERARIVQSSGDERLDRMARQAALRANPYPPVPEEQQERRFRVELGFYPAAASGETSPTANADRS